MRQLNKNNIAKGRNLLFTNLSNNLSYFKITKYFIRRRNGVGSVRLKGDDEKLLLVGTSGILIVDNIFTITGVRLCVSFTDYLECGTSRTLNVDVKLVDIFDFEGINFAC